MLCLFTYSFIHSLTHSFTHSFTHSATRTGSGTESDAHTLMNEQLTRNISFFGSSATESIRNSFVVIVGVGGVGSHAAAMLCRSGVGRMRLVDFDQISLSSLNRHATAVRSDVGRSKVECVREALLAVCPDVSVFA